MLRCAKTCGRNATCRSSKYLSGPARHAARSKRWATVTWGATRDHQSPSGRQATTNLYHWSNVAPTPCRSIDASLGHPIEAPPREQGWSVVRTSPTDAVAAAVADAFSGSLDEVGYEYDAVRTIGQPGGPGVLVGDASLALLNRDEIVGECLVQTFDNMPEVLALYCPVDATQRCRYASARVVTVHPAARRVLARRPLRQSRQPGRATAI